jgi:hypothetical protein
MKFKKKPVVIDAIKWDGNFTRELDDFFYGPFEERNPDLVGPSLYQKENYNLIIPTLEGNMRADIGDWIIKGVKGEFYPCKPDIFEQTYEAIP